MFTRKSSLGLCYESIQIGPTGPIGPTGYTGATGNNVSAFASIWANGNGGIQTIPVGGTAQNSMLNTVGGLISSGLISRLNAGTTLRIVNNSNS